MSFLFFIKVFHISVTIMSHRRQLFLIFIRYSLISSVVKYLIPLIIGPHCFCFCYCISWFIIFKQVLGTFAKLQKATISFFMSSRLFVQTEKLGFHWTHFHEI